MQDKLDSQNTTYNIINDTDDIDILRGSAENDKIYGNAGNDQLLGYDDDKFLWIIKK
ncbi:MAG: hypothetical protein AB8W37_04105 [Arsenophonus endosymbiont of Dermacentor nuttalli]